MSRKTMVGAAVLAVLLIAGFATGALAHKGKLPDDALTLVQQASALLAQNPGMSGEVKERLRAALQSKRPQGVDLKAVSAAVQALDSKDTAGARRLLTAAIMPAGMPVPPQGVRRPTPASPAPSTAAALPESPAQPAPPSVETAMKMAEPLRVRFAGSATEYALLVAAAVFIGLGGLTLRGKGKVARS